MAFGVCPHIHCRSAAFEGSVPSCHFKPLKAVLRPVCSCLPVAACANILLAIGKGIGYTVPAEGKRLMNRTSIIKSVIFAAATVAAGISFERSEHGEAMSLEGCAWVDTEEVGCMWTYRINGDASVVLA